MPSIFVSIKNRFKKSFANNATLIIYSILISIISWIVISVLIYPTTPKTVTSVPLEILLDGTSAEKNSLRVISQDITEIDVQIEGERVQIGNINPTQLTAFAIPDNITTSGQHKLTIQVKSNDGTEFDVKSITPSTVEVYFDEYITRTDIPLVSSEPNMLTEKGFLKLDSIVTPSTISITGPKLQVESITECKIINDTEQLLNQTMSYYPKHDDIEVYGETSTIDKKHLVFNDSELKVEIPVFITHILDVTYNIVNVPKNVDENFLMDRIKLSSKQITVRSSNDKILKQDEINVGQIDIRDINLANNDFTFKIDTLPSYATNMTNNDEIQAIFDPTGLATKEITVSNFVTINNPANFDENVITKEVRITIVGPEDYIAKINKEDIVLQVDLSESNAESGGIIQAPATAIIDKYKNVWSVGNWQIYVEFTNKTDLSE